MERAEDNLCSNTTNMSFISKQADGAEKVRKDLERALMAREDAIEQLENKHKVGGKLGNSVRKEKMVINIPRGKLGSHYFLVIYSQGG